MENIAEQYIIYARKFALNFSLKKAFDFYIMAFEKNPRIKAQYESEFRKYLNTYNKDLYLHDDMDVLFDNFVRSITLFPNNKFILNEMGKYFFHYGFYTEAWTHFQKALKLDIVFVNPEKNINSVQNALVPRWHFRMLNDKVRNFSYHDAIHNTIKPFTDTVIDLGPGISILSMYAHEAIPANITAIECSELIAEISERIITDNGMREIQVINKDSKSFNYFDGEEKKCKKSLLVTEMFDSGLFGENILETLVHAWKHLISKEGRIIPMKAEFYVAPVQSDCLNMRYQLSSAIKRALNILDLNVHMLTNDNPYDCEDICFFKDLKYLAAPQIVVKVDFNNVKDLQAKRDRTEPFKVKFKFTESGKLNSVVGWFTLYLTDKISITTDPRCPNRATAWQQVVFFDYIPRNVIKNETTNIDFLLDANKLTMVPDGNVEIYSISHETIRFLNDTIYMKVITKCVGLASVYLGQIADISQLNILDLCPFPIFGLLMLMRGANSLKCYAKTVMDRNFIWTVFSCNNINLKKVSALSGELDIQRFRKEKYHAIFCNFFDLCGDINIDLKDLSQALKSSHLLPGGLFIPSDVKVVAQLVNSRWLDHNNKVYDHNIGKHKVAKYLNTYQITQNFNIDFNKLEYTAMTNPVIFQSIDSEMRQEIFDAPILHNGTANAILCWYNIELMKEMKETSTKSSTAFIDGTAFILNRNVPFLSGESLELLRCSDPDGSYRIQLYQRIFEHETFE